METAALRHFLKDLCTNSHWSYAVFWKHQLLDNYKLLICEDCYCDSEKSKQKIGFGTNNCDDEHSLGYSIGSAVAEMSLCQYYIGEGVIGSVALAENDFWIYSDDSESIELMSNLECAAEWLLPIAAGIKTTSLVPLLPYGVLQLGSFERVVESLAECADIRDRFFTFTCTTITPLPNYNDNSLLCSSILVPEPENNVESSFSDNIVQRMEYEDTNTIHSAEFIESDITTTYDQLVPFVDGNYLELEDFSFFIDDQIISNPFLDTNVELNATNDLVIADIPVETATWMFSCHVEEFNEARVSGDLSAEVSSGFIPKQVEYPPAAESEVSHANIRYSEDFPADCELQDEATEMRMFSCHEEEFDDARVSGDSSGEICSDSVPKQMSRNLNIFPRDCELQVALRPVFCINDDRQTGYLYKEKLYSDDRFSFTAMETCGTFDESGELEKLLEDDSLFYRCNTGKSSATSLTETGLHDTNSTPEECNTMSDCKSAFAKSMTSFSALESLENAVVEDKKRHLKLGSELLNKNVKKAKHNRVKEKPKSKDRPRPRDRQLIQDRLKVLRKLVPDGEKCSIDGLLDQTAKHMMFLRSVTDRAEKVKHFISQEGVSNEQLSTHTSLLDVKGGNNNFEACPIIVKDLEHPSQFLIQMICTNEGVFFEMVEVMHKLKLTILKGVMENRPNKWASFIVEASKGFNRLDIFWPLMRILQQNGNWMADQLCPS